MKRKTWNIKRKIYNLNRFIMAASLLLVSSFAFYVSPAIAQFEIPTIESIKPAISLNAESRTPLPNSTVVVTADLSGAAIGNNANYDWFLNGIRQAGASGLNKNNYALKTASVGAIYRVGVNVALPTGENLSDTIRLTVGDFDLTWAADSQSPPAYRAKSLPTQNSTVVVSALPFIYQPGTITPVSSNNLIYNWTVDNKPDSEASGLNKTNYIFRAGNYFGGSHLIRLEIKTKDGAVFLSKSVTIPVVRPQVLAYFYNSESDQPFGASLKNLTTGLLKLNFIAQPYFFNAGKKDLKWQWFINNAEVGGKGEKPWLAALDLANNISGLLSAQIRVVASNPADELESSQSTINLQIQQQ